MPSAAQWMTTLLLLTSTQPLMLPLDITSSRKPPTPASLITIATASPGPRTHGLRTVLLCFLPIAQTGAAPRAGPGSRLLALKAVLSPPCCVTLGKSLNLSEHILLIWEMRMTKSILQSGPGIELGNAGTIPGRVGCGRAAVPGPHAVQYFPACPSPRAGHLFGATAWDRERSRLPAHAAE